MPRSFRNVLFYLLCLFVPAGCGYTTSSSLPGNLKTIHVAQFENNIPYTSTKSNAVYFPLLEVDARNAVVDRFHFDGNLRLTEQGGENLLLKGELIDYQRQGLRYDNDDVAEEYRILVVMSLELWDMTDETLMWREPRFVGTATYFLTGPEATSEDSAVREALNDLGRRVVERTIENW